MRGEGEGEAIYCDMTIGGVCGGICGDGIVYGLAGIGGGINEVVTVEADGVFGDLHHCAFPCDIGSEWRCADGHDCRQDVPIT